MKRSHVHVAVKDLAESVRFYSTLFAAAPSVLKGDHAKWMLDDPHYHRPQQAKHPVLEKGEEVCCYARSEKAWSTAPQGLDWETFYTLGKAPAYGEDRLNATPVKETARCVPVLPNSAACCELRRASRCGD